MSEIGYYLISNEKRKERYIEFMAEILYEYYGQISKETEELFQNQRKECEESIGKAISLASKSLSENIINKKKGKLRYIHFSYLLSSALSGEMLVKLDFYDKRYYRDVEEIDCYWNCGILFPHFEEQYTRYKEQMCRNLIRIQSGEISQLKIGLMACNYLVLKQIMSELVKSEKVLEQLMDYIEEKVFFLYGAYLEQSELIYQFIKGRV